MVRRRGRLAWRTQCPGVSLEPLLRSWLSEPGSLTARCQRNCRNFRVQLLQQGRQLPLTGQRQWQPVREVLLECDGQPVIFAHSVLSTARSGRLGRWFAQLGNRSLGSLLFRYPAFRRGPIEFCRIAAGHPLHRRLCQVLGRNLPACWARRSRHFLGAGSVLVIEVFLPAITRLGE